MQFDILIQIELVRSANLLQMQSNHFDPVYDLFALLQNPIEIVGFIFTIDLLICTCVPLIAHIPFKSLTSITHCKGMISRARTIGSC